MLTRLLMQAADDRAERTLYSKRPRASVLTSPHRSGSVGRMVDAPSAPIVPSTFASTEWRNAPASSATLAAPLRIATLNVCFDPRLRRERTRALVAAIETWNADVVALQEVTLLVLASLQSSDLVRSEYHVAVGSMEATYGVVLLSRVPFTRVDQVSLPGMMGRTLLVGRWGEGEGSVAVATLVGDMNFDPGDPEERTRDLRYTDAWPALRGNDPGYTEDTDTNVLRLLAEGGEHKQVRYDRIFVRSSSMRPTHIERVGTEPFGTPFGPSGLSDHFGVLATFDV